MPSFLFEIKIMMWAYLYFFYGVFVVYAIIRGFDATKK